MPQMNYPTHHDIIHLLGQDCILVGSAARDLASAKDIDLLVSDEGFARLLDAYEYFLVSYGPRWRVYVPFEDEEGKAMDIFGGICNIEDVSKHAGRMAFEEAKNQKLKPVQLHGCDILCVDI